MAPASSPARLARLAAHLAIGGAEGRRCFHPPQQADTTASASAAASSSGDVLECTITTSEGPIAIELFAGAAPATVANFLRYVDAGAYRAGSVTRAVTLNNQEHDGHRSPEDSVKIEVVQFGAAAASALYDPIEMEGTEVTGLSHTDGTLSMSRTGPDSATSSVFIVIGGGSLSLDAGETPHGSPPRNPDSRGFAAFGRVKPESMETVRRIQRSPTRSVFNGRILISYSRILISCWKMLTLKSNSADGLGQSLQPPIEIVRMFTN